jgi:hypothetical protein
MPQAPHLPFKVYCLRGGTAERKVVAEFARYIEAEAFVHSELLTSPDRGTDAGRFWGCGGKGGDVHFWIESPQLTASVRDKMLDRD